MKQLILIFLFFLIFDIQAAINSIVPSSYFGYKVLFDLKENNLLGDKGELIQTGMDLTRREFATMILVAIKNLENFSENEIKNLSSHLLENLERLSIDFSEELKMIYSHNIEFLSKKISFLEKAIYLSKTGKKIDYDTKKNETNVIEKNQAVKSELKEISQKKHVAEIVMNYDPDNPLIYQKVSINFKRTELSHVLAALLDGTGYNLIVSSEIKGKITIQIEDKPLIEVLKALAKSNKFDFVIKNKIVTVTPLSTTVTKVIALKYAKANEIKNLIEIYRGRRGVIKIDKRTNSLIITDTLENYRKILSLISEIDIENEKTRRVLKIFKLKYTKPKDVEKIINSMRSPNGIIQLNNENKTITVMDYQENMDKISKYIKDLDKPIATKQIITEIYHVRYAKAEDLKTIIEEDVFKNIFKDGNLKIASDPRINSLIISGYPEDVREIKKYIKQLDARNRQVVIAAKIIEVTLDDNKNFGINWEKIIPKKNAGISDVGHIQTHLFDDTTPSTISFRFGTLDSEQFTALMNTLKTYSNVKVVSNPTITTLNNKEAKILIGEKIPFEQTTTTDTGTNTEVTFEEVGIKLTVIPTISADNFITLKVHPEISQQKGVVQATGRPIIGSTEADTSIIIRNGDTLVIGGLVKESKTRISNRIPILGDIPGLGRLFRYSSVVKNRTETIIFITPTIVEYTEASPYEISEYYE